MNLKKCFVSATETSDGEFGEIIGVDYIFNKYHIRLKNRTIWRHATEITIVEEDDIFDFNIKITRDINENYFYACNNKDSQEVDLIKVIFIGGLLLEEENYSRKTVSYFDFNEMLSKKELIEDSQSGLLEYAMTRRDEAYNNRQTKSDISNVNDACRDWDCDCNGDCAYSTALSAIERATSEESPEVRKLEMNELEARLWSDGNSRQ